MKKIILTFGIFLAGVFFVTAQQTANNPSANMVAHIMKVCSLTPDQAAKLKPLCDAMVKSRKDNQEKYAGNPDKLKAANNALYDAFKKQAKTFFTADQMDKLSADIAKRENNPAK